MKIIDKNTFISILFFVCCSTSVFSQTNEEISRMLVDEQKDYLYHLCQINNQRILIFKKPSSNEQDRLMLIKNILDINFQKENVKNIPFSIKEKCDSASIKANVFFIYIENAESLIEKKGCGEIHPNKVTLTYKWLIRDNVVIFIFTSRELEHRFQKYVYL